jgi:asparagine N-glycosylation enzyme membrane subunit Stt3
VGVGPDAPGPSGGGGPEGLSPFQRAFAGAFIGVLYAIGSIARGYLLAGLVGGVLAAIVVYLVLKRYAEQRRRRR